MARGGGDEDLFDDEEDNELEEDEEEYQEEEEEEDEEEEEQRGRKGSRGAGGRGGERKRPRAPNPKHSRYIEDDDDEGEEDEDEEYGASGRGRGKRAKKQAGSHFLDIEAEVDEDEEEEEEQEEEEGFIDDGADLLPEDVGRSARRPSLGMPDDVEDIEEMERQVKKRYARQQHIEYGDEPAEVEQQALLPSVKDPKLWMVKCAIGHERETAICLMQKFIDRPELQIKSVIALDHLKNYIYVEAEKEAHVKEACKGLRNIYASAKVMLVPIKEMPEVLSVESKTVDLSRDSWVRMKMGIYKGDLAQIVDVDNVRQRVTVRLTPRIDLQALANKLEGREVPKKKAFVPQPRPFNVDEAREMHIRVERRRDRDSGEHFDMVDGLMFNNGFLYKTVSVKSISTNNIHPTFDELEKFKPRDNGSGEVGSLSTLFANRKKGHFMKGDAVIVVRGELKNLEGWVEKVEDEIVHVKPKLADLPRTLEFNEKELCKFSKPGDHVKVVSGVQEGATGMVVKVDGHVLIVLSDTTKEHIRVFADHVVESSEITMGVTRIGDYELHDLVLLDDLSFGVIIRVESEAFQVLKGVPDRPEVSLVKLREIKSKVENKHPSAKDRSNNLVSVKDVVRVVEGPCKGKQGPVEHIHKGILFVFDRHHLEHAGFICAKAQSCLLVGGSAGNRHGNSTDRADSRYGALRSPSTILQSPGRLPPRGPSIQNGGRFGGGRGHDALVARCIKIRSGPYKGYRGRVKEVTGVFVRVELDSLMKIVTVKRDDIADTNTMATPYRESRYSLGSETPMHPSRTPLHPIQTPLRDPGATPIHDGMRTPMRGRAWAPMSPPRDSWEDGNPATWGTSPSYQPPGTPPARPYEAPTPGSGWANTPGVNYSDSPPFSTSGNSSSPYASSTPGQPMTPSSASYLPGTPGGQPMTPGNVGMDVMSPIIGGEVDNQWYVPDILVNILRSGEDAQGVVKEVLSDGACRVVLGSSSGGETVTAQPGEIEVIRPKKSDRIKILNGAYRGISGKLIGIDGSDGIVKLDESYEVKILDMGILAKLAT